MATYLTLYRYTDEGMKQVKRATEIAREWERMANDFGVKVKGLYWLQGEYDAMTIVESDKEESVTALLLAIGAQGFLRTQTMRALEADVMDRALQHFAAGAKAR